MIYNPYVKRIIDFIFTLLGILILWPVFILMAILIKVNSKGPVFFRQKRIGRNKKHFNILKFRTMSIDTPKDVPTHMLSDPDSHITKIGGFLRKTSLDELPQIINIFIGDMSIVGPRPALYNQNDLIEQRDKYGVNKLYPGLTGWAQINGRDELAIPIKAALDGEYAEKISFLFDMKIFFKTVFSVLRSDGVKEGKNSDLKS